MIWCFEKILEGDVDMWYLWYDGRPFCEEGSKLAEAVPCALVLQVGEIGKFWPLRKNELISFDVSLGHLFGGL